MINYITCMKGTSNSMVDLCKLCGCAKLLENLLSPSKNISLAWIISTSDTIVKQVVGFAF